MPEVPKNVPEVRVYISIRGLFKTLSNIEYGAFCKNNEQFVAINYFRNMLHRTCLTRF